MTVLSPLQRLIDSATTGLSGEFICVTPSTEIHIYLQEGRVAWATDSSRPFAFAKHLQEIANIDADTFRQVVEECRRDKLPLGETLVAWDLVSWDLVRQALHHQIAQAISLVINLRSAQTLFLKRSYTPYEPKLTFLLQEFIDDYTPQEIRSTNHPSGDPQNRSGLAKKLRDSIDGLSWIEILDGSILTDSDPESSSSTPRTPSELLRSTLLDGSEFAALRSAEGSLIGLRLPNPKHTLWCWLAAGSTFGSVVSAIWAMVMSGEVLPVVMHTRAAAKPWCLGDQDSPLSAEIHNFMNRAHEVLGIVVLRNDRTEPVIGVGCASLERDDCLDLARRRARCFASSLTGVIGNPRAGCLDSMGFYLKSVVSGEATLWCFGIELDAVANETAWLFLDRGVAQGLGWAYLSALRRALARVSTEAVS